MATAHKAITVAATPTALWPRSGTLGLFNPTGPYGLSVQSPAGAVDVFLGGADVSATSYGHRLVAGGTYAADLDTGEVLYAAVAAGTQAVTCIFAGV